jgi:putative component of toxin-antitoxin plasmid stabilization module
VTAKINLRYVEGHGDDQKVKKTLITGVTRIEEDCGGGKNSDSREGYHELRVYKGAEFTIYSKGEIIELVVE